MPSKETNTYHWATITALQHLVIDTTLSFKQCIACDQELAIYQPLCAMIENVPCLYKSRNRLGKYHLLTQRWNSKVIVSISGKEAKTLLIFFYKCYHILLITQRIR